MIDTIVLVLKQSMFVIIDHDRFEPSTRSLYGDASMGSRGYATYKQNPTPTELKNGIYKPRLTVTRRFNDGVLERTMKIEFSAPKLLYKNNFVEIEDKDFEEIVDTLKKTLREDMGVLVSMDTLVNAPASSIHYSKNIKLTNGLIAFTVLKELSKANITKRLDFNQSDFRNEGHSIKYHANSYEIAFYDKVKDLQQAKISEKRAVEKDNAIQIGLFDDIQQFRKQKPFELLRMEARLNQRQKIRQVLKIIGNEVEPTFQNLFKKEIAQKVLLYYLGEIEKHCPKTLYFEPKSNKNFLAQFMIDNPKAKIKDTILAFGFHKALEEVTARELKELLKRYPQSSWYRFISQMNNYSYPKNALDIFKPIRQSIEQFEPLSLLDFEAEMLSNDKYLVI